ncbi:MAG: tetratricopeptide repeat protein [Candidatus Omnitrophica bacterium]|nr:tetratricopeptide repeat protein [Candidatus Omnitrophota bacterium]
MMKTVKFSIGYNHDMGLLDLLEEFKSNIEAVYFPVPYQFLSSGRNLPQGKDYIGEIVKIIKKCNSLNIIPELLLNATCDGGRGLKKNFPADMIKYIKELKDLGLKNIIVTNPVYISRIRKEIKDITIESSVNCYIKTVEHASYLKDLGVDILTIDRDINRDIPLIKKIKKSTGLKIKIMLNEGCLKNCPFRNVHYNYLSHSTTKENSQNSILSDYFCYTIYSKNPEKVFKTPFIPPEALGYYIDFVDYFKLSTRVFDLPRIKRCLEAYKEQRFSGNLLNILDSPGLSYFSFINHDALKKNNYFLKMLKCDENCAECNYCNRLKQEAAIINTSLLKGEERNKEDAKAIVVFERLLKDFPKESAIYLGLAKAYLHFKKYKEAIEILSKALSFNLNNANICYLLGVCYVGVEDFNNAIENLKKAKEKGFKSARVNFLLSGCYRRIKMKKKALRELDEGIQKIKEVNVV